LGSEIGDKVEGWKEKRTGGREWWSCGALRRSHRRGAEVGRAKRRK